MNKKKCIIELHKITSFEWDHTYFFQKENQNIVEKITNLNVKFDTSDLKDDTKVIFVKDHKIVKTEYITSGILNRYQVKLSLFANVIWISVNFWDIDPNKPTKNFRVTYYELQPNNDKLLMRHISFLPSIGPYAANLHERYDIFPTNMQQLHIKN